MESKCDMVVAATITKFETRLNQALFEKEALELQLVEANARTAIE